MWCDGVSRSDGVAVGAGGAATINPINGAVDDRSADTILHCLNVDKDAKIGFWHPNSDQRPKIPLEISWNQTVEWCQSGNPSPNLQCIPLYRNAFGVHLYPNQQMHFSRAIWHQESSQTEQAIQCQIHSMCISMHLKTKMSVYIFGLIAVAAPSVIQMQVHQNRAVRVQPNSNVFPKCDTNNVDCCYLTCDQLWPKSLRWATGGFWANKLKLGTQVEFECGATNILTLS